MVATERESELATLPHVLILGGGFSGLLASRALRHADVRVTLVDRTNHHLFQPLLYQWPSPACPGPTLRRLCGISCASKAMSPY